ncbi:MAG: HAD family hydrolase [Ignavibacteria bacterium]|nr:HAD family hydrolase [Ignavibacteria bacterium]
MNIKHICFDLDGTLVDSKTTILKSTIATLEELNIEASLPEEKFIRLIGLHFIDIFYEFKIDVPDFNKFISVYKFLYFNFIDQSVPFPGAAEVLKHFNEKGIKTSLLTTKAQDQADKIVDHFGFREDLSYVMGRRNGVAHKPSAEPLLIICDEFGIQPSDTLMVGDTELDINCGKNAGALTCGVTYGYRTEENLKDYNPDFLINEIGELEDYLN